MGPILLTAAFAAPCTDPTEALETALTSVVEGRYDDARESLAAVERTYACSAPDADTLARFWLIEGAVLVGESDPDSASLSLTAARRVAPGVFLDPLGSKVRGLWLEAGAGEGHLMLLPPPAPNEGLLDGAPAQWPVTTGAGVHLVQVRRGDEVLFGRIVNIGAGQLERIDTGIAPMGAPDAVRQPTEPIVRKRKDPPEMLILGATALALGAGSLGMWGVSNNQLDKATTKDAAHRAQERRMAYGAGAVTLGAVGVLGIAGEFVF